MRRTRGDTGFLRLLTLAERVWAPVFLWIIFSLAIFVWPDVFFLEADPILLTGWEDFVLADGT
jgi:hypothetical protein